MKNKTQTYLLPFAGCIPVKGHTRGVIMDIQRNKYFYVPNDLITIISEAEGITIDELISRYQDDSETVMEYIDFMLEKEIVFLSDTPNDFLPLPTDKWFLAEISNAIIEVGELDIFSHNLAAQLSDLNCQWVEMRYLKNDCSGLIKCINEFQNTRIRSIEVIITNSWPEEELKKVIMSSSRVSRITVFNHSDNSITKILGTDIIYSKTPYAGNLHCGNISRAEFAINLPSYLDNLNGNSCLANKISIDHEGVIRNCPSMQASFGTLPEGTTLRQALNADGFKKYWNHKKDLINICKICEHRYICTDCRAFREDPSDEFSKPLKCGYDPYTGQWSDWASDQQKLRIFNQYQLAQS